MGTENSPLFSKILGLVGLASGTNTIGKVDINGTPTVTLTGRNVQEKQGHNALAITDTTNKDSLMIDVSDLNRKAIFVVNSLNQAVDVSLIIYTSDGINALTLGSPKTLAAGVWGLVTATDIPTLAEPVSKMKIRLKCAVAPSSGSISTWVEGVKN